MLDHMFALDLPVLEKVLRPVLVYLFLVIAFRLAGKRELGQLNAFDLVVILTLANVLQNAGIGDDTTVTGGFIGAGSLLLVNYVVVRFVLSHPTVDRLIEGEPAKLVENGQLLPEALHKELITEPELVAALRRQGIGAVSEVAVAYLETGGTISAIPKRPTPEEAAEATIEAALSRIETALNRLEARAG
jgi:uncharacterized membrane protein YcaP (DUF421 family)